MIDLNALIEESRKWRKHISKLDKGSYCEEPCQEYSLGIKITKAYEDIVDNIIKLERYGYKLPQ